MADAEIFDIVVFGGGKAGKTLAMDQARAGQRVALVEEGLIGGSCINVACIPSKTLIRSAEVAHAVRGAGPYGTTADHVLTDVARVRDRTAGVVAEMVATNLAQFDASGLTLILGRGRFVAPRTIAVATRDGTRTVTAGKVAVNLGTSAALPPIPGLAEAAPMTHVELLRLGELPDHLVVLGGGYIGLELGLAFRRLGARVTIVSRDDRLVPREDGDVAAALLDVLRHEGITFVLGCDVARVEGRSGERVRLFAPDGTVFEGSHILVATGRTPRTRDVGLEAAGIAVDARGLIVVDERLRTTAENVWAMGEVAGSPMFTHASLDDYRVVKSDIAGGDRTTTGRLIPSVLFTDPELARIGLDEGAARRAGIAYRLAKLPMDVIPRARTLSRRQGFMKALVAADSDMILGFTMLGVNAGEVMAAIQVAMLGNVPYTVLRDGILAHPTIAEGFNMLFAKMTAAGAEAGSGA